MDASGRDKTKVSRRCHAHVRIVNHADSSASASRGKLSVRIYTDDKQELARAVERSGERVAASELVTGDADAGAPAKNGPAA